MRVVGWILTLRKLGDIFGVAGFHTWNLVMTVCMCVTWLVLFVLTVLAFWEGKIFISPPEDVIRDKLRIRIVDKHGREHDLEKGADLDLGAHRTMRVGDVEISVAHSDGPRTVAVSIDSARSETSVPIATYAV